MALSEFGQAFRDARNAGEKTFTFKGKTYTTRTADEEGASKAKARSDARSADVERKRQIAEIAGQTSGGNLNPAVDAAGRSYQAAKETAAGEDAMEGYKPRYTPSPMRPKMTTGDQTSLMKKGGSVSSASRRADGIASRGKTKGRMV